jgi:quinol monooxygenase YgiN
MGEAGAEVVVVAIVEVLPGHGDRLTERFASVIEGSHTEEGCLTYALHRDRSNPDRFVLVERWRSQEDLDAHFAQPHMNAIAGLADSIAGAPEVVFCEPIPYGDPAKNLAGNC